MSTAPHVIWLRNDLRLTDNAALVAAGSSQAPVIPVYILDDTTPGDWAMGGASRWWLHGGLDGFSRQVAGKGGRLLLRRGASLDVLMDLTRTVGARAIHWNAQAEPYWRDAEDALAGWAREAGIETHRHPGSTLFERGSILGRSGQPLRVFTPFWRACQAAAAPPEPLPAPHRLPMPEGDLAGLTSDDLASWALRPTTPDWAGGLRETWTPGEAAAERRLADFLDDRLANYVEGRDQPEPTSTSGLSAHLHFGEISARRIWHAVAARMDAEPAVAKSGEAFLREIGWREFCGETLAREPQLPDRPLQEKFAAFPWRDDVPALRAWQRGLTGYPIVDAGMRQLWHTGWMHNRARMIVGSFLVKHLLLPWQAGEAWFWDTLVDADLANNAAGWQWIAGCGVDAAPYFRIFNPMTQGEKFDADGAYVRRWVPELRALADRWIHKPWQAPPLELEAAGIRLGETYPQPIVDHAVARKRALEAFDAIKGGGADR